MAEEPYDNLDIGYVEWPMPTTEEFTYIRFLSKDGLARLWTKIKDKFMKIPVGGTTGQVLCKTDTGFGWKDISEGNFIVSPEGGTAGQALFKTDTGYEWADIPEPEEVPQASSTQYGTVRFASEAEFNSYMGIF